MKLLPVSRFAVLYRKLSTTQGQERLVNVTTNSLNDVAIISLLKPPVNSLDTRMLCAIRGAVEGLHAGGCQGIILTSECPTVFCAGLDIKELFNPDPLKLRVLWKSLQDTWETLYSFPNPLAAAINGHSPAGGCMLALTCDYRAMVHRKFTIGLNEAQLGLPCPFWLQECMRNVIGTKEAEKALLAGTLFTTSQASHVGLIDEIAVDCDDAISKAEDFIEAQLNLPGESRRLTKALFRERTLEHFRRGRDEDLEETVKFILRPQVQIAIENYLSSLKKT